MSYTDLGLHFLYDKTVSQNAHLYVFNKLLYDPNTEKVRGEAPEMFRTHFIQSWFCYIY